MMYLYILHTIIIIKDETCGGIRALRPALHPTSPEAYTYTYIHLYTLIENCKFSGYALDYFKIPY